VSNLIRIVVTYGRGKPFQRDNVTKVVYTDKENTEIIVEGDELLTHRFPVAADLYVYADDGLSTANCQGLRSISTFSVSDAE